MRLGTPEKISKWHHNSATIFVVPKLILLLTKAGRSAQPCSIIFEENKQDLYQAVAKSYNVRISIRLIDKTIDASLRVEIILEMKPREVFLSPSIKSSLWRFFCVTLTLFPRQSDASTADGWSRSKEIYATGLFFLVWTIFAFRLKKPLFQIHQNELNF